MKRRGLILLATVLLGHLLMTACQFPLDSTDQQKPPPIPTLPPGSHPETILGIQADPQSSYPGIPWVRLAYPTCGPGPLSGKVLKDSIQHYHQQGIHVLLTYCQASGERLFDTNRLTDAAQGEADAVQCGNEQMKQSTSTLYVTPERFATFFDLCQHIMQTVPMNRPALPIILGAMDPLVVPDDMAKLEKQVQYLDAMQSAMNTSVHPGWHWDWHSQILGLIDSWHNGYPSKATNNLYHLFAFWAQQEHVALTSGKLGKHIWVVEGTGCVNGCGIDASSASAVAISHILTMITDVQTTLGYQVPFFYFSGKDFFQQGQTQFWPMGVLDVNGHPKPLRQDLPMGARTLEMSCSSGKVLVTDQEQLLARLYSGCTPPSNYVSTLES